MIEEFKYPAFRRNYRRPRLRGEELPGGTTLAKFLITGRLSPNPLSSTEWSHGPSLASTEVT